MSGRPTTNSQRTGLTDPLPVPSRRRQEKARAPEMATPSLLDHTEPEDDLKPNPNPDCDPSDDGGDDDGNTMDDDQDPPEHREDGPMLAHAIAMLSHTLQQPREPSMTPSKV